MRGHSIKQLGPKIHSCPEAEKNLTCALANYPGETSGKDLSNKLWQNSLFGKTILIDGGTCVYRIFGPPRTQIPTCSQKFIS